MRLLMISCSLMPEYSMDTHTFATWVADDLNLDTIATNAAVRLFMDGEPLDVIGKELGMPVEEARTLAYKGLRGLKDSTEPYLRPRAAKQALDN
jgi:hypothetical protein